MTERRPDPDLLLEQVRADEARARRGRLKIFFGASAGVGKTCAMLVAARTALAQGTDLTVGLIETHGRSGTEAMARGLPRLPLKSIRHRERSLQEFDLDAALAFGAAHDNALLILDELAHSNAPGSRHPKRWQDVDELLGAGVDVWTTMNVQHLESLNDVVGGITGIRVWETVPDRIFDQADEVVMVDLPPDDLLERLAAGQVYLASQAERAARNFFRKGNLLALRELALRRTADRVDGEMQAYRHRNAVATVWPNRESLLACVGTGEASEKVVRSCARLAAQLDVPWHAVHVEVAAQASLSEVKRAQVLRALKLAEQLGATTAQLSGAELPEVLVRYARDHNLSRLVLGRREQGWRWSGRSSLAQALSARADDLDVLQIALPATARQPRAALAAGAAAAATLWPWPHYVAAVLVCAAVAVLATPLLAVLELSNIVMLFLLAVIVVALRWGRGPAVLAAFVGVGLFDFFFVPPRFTFAVSDAQYLVTFVVMLVVALVVGQLTAGLKVQARVASEREQGVRRLYELTRDLSGALRPAQVAEIGIRFLAAEFGAKGALLVAGDDGKLKQLPGAIAVVDLAVAQWAHERGEPAGRGTDTLPSSACLMLPLKAPMRGRGVLAVATPDERPLGPEQRRRIEVGASLLAISLERIHYVEVVQASIVQVESERLRNSLLSAISHDLRTPLAALVGLAETLSLTQPRPSGRQVEIVDAMRHSALRMNALVNNLLDMARLESGAVQLNRQWQPIEEVLGSALAACGPSLAGRPLQVKLPDDLPLLEFDAGLIERVLVNLLENAAKYTPAGAAIEIAASAEPQVVILTVSDHGPGLPRGREDAIFQKFERGHKESATSGVGLGLAICRAIVQAHGGSIRGETLERGGARFSLTLPRGEPPRDDGAQADLEALEEESSR